MMSAFVKRKALGLAVSAAVCCATTATAERAVEKTEFPEETAAIMAATTAFFDAAERAAMAKPRSKQPVIGLPEVVSPASAQSGDSAYEALTNHGAVQHLTGYRINWYPVARLLGTVDFMGTWGNNRNLVCGYISWDLTEPDAPILETVETAYLDLSELAAHSRDQVHEALLEANCAFGSIDANFAVFEPIN